MTQPEDVARRFMTGLDRLNPITLLGWKSRMGNNLHAQKIHQHTLTTPDFPLSVYGFSVIPLDYNNKKKQHVFII